VISLPTWIKLSNLPLESWSNATLRAIGDTLWKFIAPDDKYKSWCFRSMAQILVDLDPCQGLFETISLVMRDRTYTQVLDYVNIPFECTRCHKVGHFFSDCELNF
jgi:hypothetical protein